MLENCLKTVILAVFRKIWSKTPSNKTVAKTEKINSTSFLPLIDGEGCGVYRFRNNGGEGQQQIFLVFFLIQVR